MKHRRSLAIAFAVAGLLLVPGARGAQDSGHADSHDHHHHAAPAPGQLGRTTSSYTLPQVTVLRQDGAKVEFAREIEQDKPVFLNFVYTTCTAICPPMSQVFSEFQNRLGAERDRVKMVSVSIDPEQDTPKRLAAYAKQYKAGPQWSFYTGTVEASIAIQKAFAVYRNDKMNHTPLTLVRAAPGQPWLRLDGFATPGQLMEEYRRIAAAK